MSIDPSIEKRTPCNDYYYQQEELRIHYSYWQKEEKERIKEINSKGV
jgi:hypothetical protein